MTRMQPLRHCLLALALCVLASCSPEGNEDILSKDDLDRLAELTATNGKIYRMQWDQTPFLPKLAQLGVPVILRHPKIEKVRATKMWNPAYITKKLDTLPSVERSRTKTLMFRDEDRGLAEISAITWERLLADRNVNTSWFFEQVSADKPGNGTLPYYYVHTKLNRLGPLENDVIGSWSWIYQDHMKWLGGWGKKGIQTNVWIGAHNVTTHLHYDSFHNVYVQVHGTKRFQLLPPDAHMYTYLYPHLHPHDKQSQVDVDDPDYTAFPLWHDVQFTTVDLEAGDVLFLPAYWFHHVTATSLSISFNTWVPSMEHMYQEIATQEDIPVNAEWTVPQRVRALRLYLVSMADKLFSRRTVLRDLWQTRYVPLYGFKDRVQRHRPLRGTNWACVNITSGGILVNASALAEVYLTSTTLQEAREGKQPATELDDELIQRLYPPVASNEGTDSDVSSSNTTDSQEIVTVEVTTSASAASASSANSTSLISSNNTQHADTESLSGKSNETEEDDEEEDESVSEEVAADASVSDAATNQPPSPDTQKSSGRFTKGASSAKPRRALGDRLLFDIDPTLWPRQPCPQGELQRSLPLEERVWTECHESIDVFMSAPHNVRATEAVLQPSVDKMVEHLQHIENESIREIIFMDIVEEALYSVLEDPALVELFLRRCSWSWFGD